MADGNHNPPYSESHGCNLPGAAASSSAGDGCINGQDHLLPIAIVGRLMKQALPPGAKVSKDAKETMQECATEFIGFVTGEATDRCRKEKRKTINGDDICCAFKTLGLDEYANVMRRYLDKYREHGEKAISMKLDKSIQIDMRDELSATRSDQYKNQELAMFPHETNVLERGRKFL